MEITAGEMGWGTSVGADGVSLGEPATGAVGGGALKQARVSARRAVRTQSRFFMPNPFRIKRYGSVRRLSRETCDYAIDADSHLWHNAQNYKHEDGNE